MQTDTVRLLAAYNKEADKKMNEAVKTLSAAEWEKDLGGFFPSVRSLCSHTYYWDLTWFGRFARNGDFKAAADPLLNREYSRTELFFPRVEDFLNDRSALDDLLIRFTGELSDEDLARPLKEAGGGNCGALMLHAFNHQTHHRGMISLYLELLGRANDFNSLSAYLRDGISSE
jgi:uncharacterized damage-inducible protein DinB